MNQRCKNSGIVQTATTVEYYDGGDSVIVKQDYLGILEEIIELYYFWNNQIVLCKWLWYNIDSEHGQRLKMVLLF